MEEVFWLLTEAREKRDLSADFSEQGWELGQSRKS